MTCMPQESPLGDFISGEDLSTLDPHEQQDFTELLEFDRDRPARLTGKKEEIFDTSGEVIQLSENGKKIPLHIVLRIVQNTNKQRIRDALVSQFRKRDSRVEEIMPSLVRDPSLARTAALNYATLAVDLQNSESLMPAVKRLAPSQSRDSRVFALQTPSSELQISGFLPAGRRSLAPYPISYIARRPSAQDVLIDLTYPPSTEQTLQEVVLERAARGDVLNEHQNDPVQFLAQYFVRVSENLSRAAEASDQSQTTDFELRDEPGEGR